MLALLLLSCGGTLDVDTGEAVEPSPWIVEEGEVAQPTLTEADMEGALEELMVRVRGLHATPVLDVYDALMDHTEAYCPNWYEADGNAYWFDECTTGNGTHFSGYGFGLVYDGYENPEDGYVYDARTFNGVAEITDPQGDVFVSGGSAYVYEITPMESTGADPHTLYYSGISGGFAWSGGGVEGSWLADGETPDLLMSAGYLDNLEGRFLTLEGGVTDLSGEFDTIVMSDVSLYDELLGSYMLGNACPEEVSGIVSFRDPGGQWVDVIFDGPTQEDPGDSDLCDGCGRAWYLGEPLGAVCPDFTGLLNWPLGDRPW